MIENALILLREELSSYLVHRGYPVAVIVENVGLRAKNHHPLQGHQLVISLLNIEPDLSLKNAPVHQKKEITTTPDSRQFLLNLYVLVSADYNTTLSGSDDYLQAIRHLSLTVEFFEDRPVFTPASSIVHLPAPLNDISNPGIRALRLTVELDALHLKQLAHLWALPGAGPLLSVLYKVRMVTVVESHTTVLPPSVQKENG